MHRLVTSLLAKKLSWIIQKRHARQVQYISIDNIFEIQQLLHNVIKFQIYGHAKDFSYKLDSTTELWCPKNIAFYKMRKENNTESDETNANKKKPETQVKASKRNKNEAM